MLGSEDTHRNTGVPIYRERNLRKLYPVIRSLAHIATMKAGWRGPYSVQINDKTLTISVVGLPRPIPRPFPVPLRQNMGTPYKVSLTHPESDRGADEVYFSRAPFAMHRSLLRSRPIGMVKVHPHSAQRYHDEALPATLGRSASRTQAASLPNTRFVFRPPFFFLPLEVRPTPKRIRYHGLL